MNVLSRRTIKTDRPDYCFRIGGTKKEIQNKVKEAVEKHGDSQKEVADYMGVHYSMVNSMINARNKT